MGGDPNVNVTRTAVIGKPDAEQANGLLTIARGVTGATADAYEYTAACSSAG